MRVPKGMVLKLETSNLIAYLALPASGQVKGFGSRLMTHLKQHILTHEKITHLLTFADNNAVGYFTKQGFSKEITLNKEMWSGYIKEYDGGTFMEGLLDPSIPYTRFHEVIKMQREEVDKEVRKHSNRYLWIKSSDAELPYEEKLLPIFLWLKMTVTLSAEACIFKMT